MKKKTTLSQKFANFIVEHRVATLIVSAILIIPSIVGMLVTRVNYDMLNYLPDTMETVIGQDELMEEFHKGAFSIVIVEDLSDEQVAAMTSKISAVNHVDTALSYGSLAQFSKVIPAGLLPDNIYDVFHHDTETIIAVFFDTSTSADATMDAITNIRKIVDGHAQVSGMSAMVTDLRDLCENEEIIYVVIAVSLALAIMLLFLDNWLISIIFLVCIGLTILINMGTNIIFGEISYITKALSAVLQLAVTMDYSIFLWHSYREHREKGDDSKKAMKNATAATMSSVLGGSTTTIAGFIALCFMTFTLGLDLGLVMAKGVLFGVIGSVTVLPATILLCDKILNKTNHKPLLPKFEKLSQGIIKIFPALAILMVLILPPAIIGYTNASNDVYYEISKSLPQDLEFAEANKKLAEDFGLSNTHIILTKSDLEAEKMHELTVKISQVEGVKSVLNMDSLIASKMPIESLPKMITGLTKGEKWEMSLVVSEYGTATDEMNAQIGSLKEILKTYDDSAMLIGEASCTQDMIDLTSVDFQVVTIVSIILVFIIIAVVTKSLTLPFILIAVIETAIFINLGIPYFTGNQLSFITPICVSTIQLGATVDYAILMTTRFKAERVAGKDKKKAAMVALKTSLPSIIVSSMGLFAATFGVAMYSDIDIIRSICLLIASGALISAVCVVFFLPSCLIIFDKIIAKTTKGMKNSI